MNLYTIRGTDSILDSCEVKIWRYVLNPELPFSGAEESKHFLPHGKTKVVGLDAHVLYHVRLGNPWRAFHWSEGKSQ